MGGRSFWQDSGRLPGGPAPARVKYLAGTESGMGVWINDVLPQEAARRLRERE